MNPEPSPLKSYITGPRGQEHFGASGSIKPNSTGKGSKSENTTHTTRVTRILTVLESRDHGPAYTQDPSKALQKFHP